MTFKILFVDGHSRRHVRLLRAIMEAGFDLALVNDDQEALHWLEGNNPDAILFDAAGHSLARLVVLQQIRTRLPERIPVFIELDEHDSACTHATDFPDEMTFAFDSHVPQSVVGSMCNALGVAR